MILRRPIAPLLVVFLLPATGLAQARVELPLQGYFRAGRYMPVLVRGEGSTVNIRGEGIVPAEVRGAGAIIAPVLVSGSEARQVQVGSPGGWQQALPLRALRDDELLAGFVAPPSGAIASLFPGGNVVSLQLDPALLAARVPVLLQPLDLLVLERWPGPIQPEDLSYSLACGVAVLVRQPERPDERWPWRRVEAGWLLRADPIGPAGALVGEAAYLPVPSWDASVPASTRRLIVLSAAAFAILALGSLLLPRWLALGALGAVTLLLLVLLVLWQQRQSPLRSIRGQIAVEHDALTQWDAWTWFGTRAGGAGTVEFHADVRPALLDRAHADRAGLRLRWGETWADRQWIFELEPGARLGFIARLIVPDQGGPSVPPASLRSPMLPLAQALYRREGYRIAGEIPQPPDWPTVVLTRR